MLPRIVELCLALAVLCGVCGGEVCQVMPTRSLLLEETSGNASADALELTTPSADDNLLTCPGPDDPANFTACCYDYEDEDDGGDDEEKDGSGEGSGEVAKAEDDSGQRDNEPKIRKPRCCAPKFEQNFLDWVLGLDDRVAMIVALSVTGTLLLVTVTIVVCCFWSKCPLYYTCRVKYDKDDIIATAGDEETANLTDMPEEKGGKGYSPNEVKVTTLNEEEEPCLKKEKEADEQQPLVEKKDDKKKEDKKKEDKKKEEKKKEEKKKEEKKKEEKKKEEKKKEEKKKDEKKKDEKNKDEKKSEEAPDNKEEKKDEPVEKKEEPKEEEKKDEETKEEK